MQPAFGSIPEGGSRGGHEACSLPLWVPHPTGRWVSFCPGRRAEARAGSPERPLPAAGRGLCPPPRRSLVLKCSSYRQARWWGQQITELATSKGHEHLQRHRHEGFAPVREETPARW